MTTTSGENLRVCCEAPPTNCGSTQGPRRRAGGPRPQGRRPMRGYPRHYARLLVHLRAPPSMTRNPKPTRSPHPDPPKQGRQRRKGGKQACTQIEGDKQRGRRTDREGRAAILGGWRAVRLWCGCNEEKRARKTDTSTYILEDE